MGGVKMSDLKTTESQRRARDKWLREKVEDIKFRVPTGQKSLIQAHAEKMGESVNAFVNRAVQKTMKNDNNAQQE